MSESALPLAISRTLAASGAATCHDLLVAGATDNDIERWVRQGLIERRARNRYVLPWDEREGKRPGWRLRHLVDLRALLAVAPDATVAGRSAALLHGLPVTTFPPLPEIIRANNRGRLRGARTIRLPLPEVDQVTVEGLRTTSLERTSVDVALDLPTPDALITVDAALRAGASLERLQQSLRARGRARGSKAARQTLDWADGAAETPGESYSRGRLLAQGIPRPRCNVTISWQGTSFRVDNLWECLGIVGEFDGRTKYEEGLATARTLWQEKRRQHWLEERGFLVLRWIHEEARDDPEGIARRWRELATRRELDPWHPPDGLTMRNGPMPDTTGYPPAI